MFTPIPGRLVKHGAYFDFMIAWRAAKPSSREWLAFIALLGDELKTSRAMQDLLRTNRLPGRKKYHIIHRPLALK